MRPADDRTALVDQGILTDREYDVRHAPVRDLTLGQLIEAYAVGSLSRRLLAAEIVRRLAEGSG